MNYKKSAMTLVEIVLVLAIIGVVMTSVVGVVKHRIQNKGTQKVKATLYNLQKVNDFTLSNLRKNGTWSYSLYVKDVCALFMDALNTKRELGCALPEHKLDDANFVMANGVSVCGMTGSWKEPKNGIKHRYKDIKFDVDGNLECSGEPYNLRIFKDDSIVVPLDEEILDDTSIARYKVIQKRDMQSNYVKTYNVIDKELSFGKAACIAGYADEFMTTEERKKIDGCERDNRCARYFDCEIQIMDIPASVVMFNGKQ